MAGQPKSPNSLIDIDLSQGMNVDSLDKEGMPWVQNALFRAGRWETRGGFGTLAQFGTTLNSGREQQALQSYGYGPPAAAALQITNQDHVQIHSIHPLNAYTGTLTGQPLENLFALSVYDVTTGRRAEHVFRNQTQGVSNIPYVRLPSAATPQWLVQPNLTTPSTAQLADLQYVCIPDQGVWFYRPIDPLAVDQRLQTAQGCLQNGDDSWVESMTPKDGVFAAAGQSYFNAATFPAPQAIATFQNRMVYANGRKLFFSDVDRPDNILANSFYPVPTEMPITAIASVKGVILVFTAQETWLYQPNQESQSSTGLISGGQVFNLSRSVGCFSPQSLIVMNDTVVFIDRRGVWSNDGGAAITKLSDPIDSWFSLPEQIQNPMTSYLTQQGLGTLHNEQPRAFIDFTGQLAKATLAYDSQNSLLYITLLDITLVYSQTSGWATYLYETTAVPYTGTPKVGVQHNILNPIILCHGGDTYMVGGPDVETYPNGGSPSIVDSSIYILQLGRGGSLDRSSVTQEDLRQPAQSWEAESYDPSKPTVWVAPPVLLPDGFKTSHQTTAKPTWCVPVFAANAATPLSITQVTLDLQFDNTMWQVLEISHGTNADYIVPPARLKSKTAFKFVQIQQGGFPNANGDTVHIQWDCFGVPNTWTSYPNLNLNPSTPQPFLYLLMQRKDTTESETSCQMTWVATTANINSSPCNVILCQESGKPSYPEQDLGDNTHAQPVDWAITTPLQGDGKAQYKALGTYSTVQSYGTATESQVPNWIIKPYGTITTSDFKDFSAQFVDFQRGDLDGDPNIIPDAPTPRFRIRDMSTVLAPMGAKVGNSIAKWSDSSHQNTGNMLIDDAATDTIATSEGVRGERFRTMMFGCLNSNGEQVKVSKVKIYLRMTGSFRLTGRRKVSH